jgi:dTMP kinase
LSIILTGEPHRARHRADKRGIYSRFHRGGLERTVDEVRLYGETVGILESAGWPVLVHRIKDEPADVVAQDLCDVIVRRFEHS